jgi:YVTN family beta-propeller protein
MIKSDQIIFTICTFGFLSLNACNDKANSTAGLYEHGVVITNEGSLNSNTGSVSYYNPNTDSVYNDIFETANNRPLGDIVQSFSVTSDKGFIVVNNSQKVEVVQLNNFKSTGVIIASYPRYFISINNEKGYLTNGAYPGQVLVINTSTLKITDTLSVGNQPEHLLLVGSKVFVANGNWGNDSTISVIDAKTDKVLKTIAVGDGASNLTSGSDNVVWILCQGKKVYNTDYTQVILETDSRLVKMDASNYSILSSRVIGVKGDACNPYLLASDKTGNIYYVEADGVHKVTGSSSAIEDKLLIPWDNSSGFAIYGMNVDPKSSNIYLLEPKGFSSAGKFHIYDGTGKHLHIFDVGIGPNDAISY